MLLNMKINNQSSSFKDAERLQRLLEHKKKIKAPPVSQLKGPAPPLPQPHHHAIADEIKEVSEMLLRV